MKFHKYIREAEERVFNDVPLGRHNGTEKDVDSEQLAMGIKVEMEHVPDGLDESIAKDIATRIALDHLSEIDDYYTRLLKMEEDAKKENGDIEE
jgi:hypothetical protein